MTVALAKRMSVNFPKTVTAKVGQTIKSEKVKMIKLGKKGGVFVQYQGTGKKLFPWYVWKNRLAVGSGADPIYLIVK
jgi:hypothetical protein